MMRRSRVVRGIVVAGAVLLVLVVWGFSIAHTMREFRSRSREDTGLSPWRTMFASLTASWKTAVDTVQTSASGWQKYTHPVAHYTIAFPASWTIDPTRTNSQSLFITDPAGAFLWVTLPALGFDDATSARTTTSFVIDGTIPATRTDADGFAVVAFQHTGQDALIRIEYNFTEAATYKPIVQQIIQSFTFQR